MHNWMEHKLDTLLLDNFDGAWGSETDNGSGVTVLRSTNMRGGQLTFHEAARCSIPNRIIKKKRLIDGDILVNKSSGSAHLVGASVMFSSPNKDEDFLCSNFIRCLRPNKTLVDPEYLYFALQSPHFRAQIFNAQRTTSGLRNLKINEYLAGVLPMPSTMEEQRHIVARIKECMERVEEIESLRTENSKMAGMLYKSRWTELYDELLINTPLYEFGDIVADTKLGLVRSKKEQSPDRTYPYVKMQDISSTGHLNLSNLTKVDATDKELEANCIEIGDFLFNTRNSYELVGKTAIVSSLTTKTLFNNNILRVRFKDGILPSFVNHVFQHTFVRSQLDVRKNKTTSVCAIYWKMLATVKIPIPQFHVQCELVKELDCFAEVHKEIIKEIKICDKRSRQLRASILRKAFAGEL